MDHISQFRKELRELLDKYNVTIAFSVGDCSDTHGLYEEKMVVFQTVPNSFKTEDWIVVNGWSIDKHDLKDEE